MKRYVGLDLDKINAAILKTVRVLRAVDRAFLHHHHFKIHVHLYFI